MKPETIGRVLGIGVRVAGRVAGERLGASAGPSQGTGNVQQTQARAVNAGQALRNAQKGTGGFLRPFRRVGSIVFLEVMGVFFLLFVLVFAQMLWRARASYATGPDHKTFLLAAGLELVFLYLSASSFWRSRRK